PEQRPDGYRPDSGARPAGAQTAGRRDRRLRFDPRRQDPPRQPGPLPDLRPAQADGRSTDQPALPRASRWGTRTTRLPRDGGRWRGGWSEGGGGEQGRAGG